MSGNFLKLKDDFDPHTASTGKINKKNESIHRLVVVKLQNITKHKHTKQNEKV